MFTWKPFNFSELFRDEVFLDCVLLTSDQKSVKTHKSVLCAISPYLKTILIDHEMVDETFVTLNDFQYKDVVNFINFIYHGEALLTNEEAKEVINILDFFQVPFNGEKQNTHDIQHSDNGSNYHSSFVDCSDNKAPDETFEVTSPEQEPMIISVQPVIDQYGIEEELPAVETAPMPGLPSVPAPMPGLPSVPAPRVIYPNLTTINPDIKCFLIPQNPGPSTPIYFVANVGAHNTVQSLQSGLQQSTIVNANYPSPVNSRQRPKRSSSKRSNILRSAKIAKLELGKSDSSSAPNQEALEKKKTSGRKAARAKPLKNSKQGKAINLPKKEEIIEMLENDLAGEGEPSFAYSEEVETVDSPNWGFDTDNEVDNFLDETSDISCSSANEPLYSCSLCSRSFTSDAALDEHIPNCNHRRPKYSGEHPCPICGKRFTTKMSARRHVKDLHGKLISYRQPVKPMAQEIENVDQSDTHKKPEALMCDLCGYLTTKETKMRDHMNYHTGARPYLCEVCSNTFLTKIALQSHKKQHKREKVTERKCKLCGLVFYVYSTFMCHMRRHQLDPDYKPTVTGQFKCRSCEKQFASRLSVKLHEQKAHRDGNKPNEANVCSVCKESFDSRFSLHQHMNEHRTIECTYCHKFFVTEWAMRTHQKHLRCKVIVEQIKNGIPYVPEPAVKRNVKCKTCEECFTSAEYHEHKNGLCRGYVDPSRAHVSKRVKRYPKGHTPWQDVSSVVEATKEHVEKHVNRDGEDKTACISV